MPSGAPRRAPKAPPRPEKREGVLWKADPPQSKWQRRHFRLSDDSLLEYFEDAKSKKAKGTVEITKLKTGVRHGGSEALGAIT